MTTDLEKQFFEVFNIPKIYRTAINIGDLDYNCVEITAPTLEQLYEDAQIDFDTPSEFEEFKNNTDLWEHEYPEITDRILLELMALLMKQEYTEFYYHNDEYLFSSKLLGSNRPICNRVNNLRELILRTATCLGGFTPLKDEMLQQVQALFQKEEVK